MPLCILGGGKLVSLAVAGFTLTWTHTVEKIPWEEDWRIDGDSLILEEARIKGSGAGMEPPPEARLVDDWYVWHPRETRAEIVLRRGPVETAGDWRLCAARSEPPRQQCRPIGEVLDEDPLVLKACDGSRQ